MSDKFELSMRVGGEETVTTSFRENCAECAGNSCVNVTTGSADHSSDGPEAQAEGLNSVAYELTEQPTASGVLPKLRFKRTKKKQSYDHSQPTVSNVDNFSNAEFKTTNNSQIYGPYDDNLMRYLLQAMQKNPLIIYLPDQDLCESLIRKLRFRYRTVILHSSIYSTTSRYIIEDIKPTLILTFFPEDLSAYNSPLKLLLVLHGDVMRIIINRMTNRYPAHSKHLGTFINDTMASDCVILRTNCLNSEFNKIVMFIAATFFELRLKWLSRTSGLCSQTPSVSS